MENYNTSRFVDRLDDAIVNISLFDSDGSSGGGGAGGLVLHGEDNGDIDDEPLWSPAPTPFENVWYRAVLIVLYGIVCAGCIVGKLSAWSDVDVIFR
jgi:hypothetical protein